MRDEVRYRWGQCYQVRPNTFPWCNAPVAEWSLPADRHNAHRPSTTGRCRMRRFVTQALVHGLLPSHVEHLVMISFTWVSFEDLPLKITLRA
jgi:hypothetical protein